MGGLPAPLLGPYVERQLAALGHTPPARVLFAETPGEPARRGAGRAIADGITAGTRIRPDGKPEGANGAAVSAAHAGALTMAVTGPSGVGCDVEPVADRPAHVWRDLLGSDRATLADLIARERPEPYAAGATRVWAAIESLKKAGAAAGAPLVLDRIRDDGWVTLRAGRYAVSTWVAERAAEHTVALAVATGDARAGV
jgi:enediyne polyketide synthase